MAEIVGTRTYLMNLYLKSTREKMNILMEIQDIQHKSKHETTDKAMCKLLPIKYMIYAVLFVLVVL